MKIGFYDQYLDSMGGGEKYMLDIAIYCQKKGHTVSFFWHPEEKNDILTLAQKRFGFDISSFLFIPVVFNEPSLRKKISVTKEFDIIFYIGDGSIPFLFAKKNILIVQYPIPWVKYRGLRDYIKLKNIHRVICYSQFVKNYIDITFHRSSTVIPPAVASIKNVHQKKEKIILSVGRFTQGMNMKKQEVMIEAFKKVSKKLTGWRFVCIGAVLSGDEDYVLSLQDKAKNYPIELRKNIDRAEIISYYKKAMIYWHATGFEENIDLHPERAEHFGITTVEAMSARCVPIVFAAGGQVEIVQQGYNGFIWKTIPELLEYTEKLAFDHKLFDVMGRKAEEQATKFSQQIFEFNLLHTLNI